MKMRLPRSSQNWVSLVGATIALISFSWLFFLFVISTIFNQGNTYLGLNYLYRAAGCTGNRFIADPGRYVVQDPEG